MDVDKLFKLPSLPSSAVNKRKWKEDSLPLKHPSSSSVTTVDETQDSQDARGSKKKMARVEDGVDTEADARMSGGGAAESSVDGPEEEFYEEDDEDPRFFSGGLTAEQAHILDIMDRDPGSTTATDPSTSSLAAESVSDLSTLRKQLVRFERAITKNSEQRAKFLDQPEKFIDSEADLHSEIQNLLFLTGNPTTLYPEFVKLGADKSLVGLLSHDNIDISAKVLETLVELTDEDVIQNNTTESGDDGAINTLIEAFLRQDLLELLVSNLNRFNDHIDEADQLDKEAIIRRREELENESQAIYNTLSVIENLVSFRPILAKKLINQTGLLRWLMTRISLNPSSSSSSSSTDAFDQNTAYAGELLAILMQQLSSDPETLSQVGRIQVPRSHSASNNDDDETDGIDALLTVLSRYRKRGPGSTEEQEFVENLLDALCLCLTVVGNKQLFLDNEGVELMILFLKDKKSFVRNRAIKVLDFAMSSGTPSKDNSSASSDVMAVSEKICETFVTENGLGPFFSFFMDTTSAAGGKKSKSKKSSLRTTKAQDAEHMLGILTSLFNNLESDSIPRIRLLTKFVSDDYEKLDRLLELREQLTSRLDVAIQANQRQGQKDDEDEEDLYLTKLEAGLFSLQLLDTSLAWLVMEDDAIKDHVLMLLRRNNLSFRDIRNTLSEYLSNIGDVTDSTSSTINGIHNKDQDQQQQPPEDSKIKTILSNLILYLNALI